MNIILLFDIIFDTFWKTKFYKVFNPADNKLLGDVPDCDIEDTQAAVEAAEGAFKIWSNHTAEVLTI